MKKISVLILILTAFVTSNAFSQEFFYAEEAYDQAVEVASSESLNSPQLILCMSLQMPDVGLGFPFEFDWDNGKGTVWVYYFVEKDNPAKNVGVVAMNIPFIGIMVIKQDIQEWIEDISEYYSLTTSLTKSQLNSKRMAEVFSGNAEFKNELNQYGSTSDIFISLFNNAAFPGLEQGKSYWGVVFDPEVSDRVCAMQIESEEVSCDDITSVNEFANDNLEIKLNNNPVDDVLTFEYDSNVEYSLTIVDMLGNQVKTINNVMDFTEIDVTDLNPGAYIIQLQNGKDIQYSKFIKR